MTIPIIPGQKTFNPSCAISSRNQPISDLFFWEFLFSGRDLQLGLVFCLLVYTIDSIRCPITNLGHNRKRETVNTKEVFPLPFCVFGGYKWVYPLIVDRGVRE